MAFLIYCKQRHKQIFVTALSASSKRNISFTVCNSFCFSAFRTVFVIYTCHAPKDQPFLKTFLLIITLALFIVCVSISQQHLCSSTISAKTGAYHFLPSESQLNVLAPTFHQQQWLSRRRICRERWNPARIFFNSKTLSYSSI